VSELSPETIEAVQEAVAETMESIAFMEAIPMEEDPAEMQADDLLGSWIEVKHPIQAGLTLLVPQELAMEITRSIYGVDEEVVFSEAEARDTLAELVNIVAGRLMSKITPSDLTFELGLPERCDIPPEAGQDSFMGVFDVEGAPLFLYARGDLGETRTMD
jgi:CheY-specific phosphatase CheX